MHDPQLDQFVHALEWKAVPPLVLAAIGAGLLGFAFKWFENWLVRTLRSARARKKATREGGEINVRHAAETAISTTIHCPICNSLMVRRTARRGANAGSLFWGCPKYPDCRGTRPI
jgi:hypothetical protein